VFLEEQGVKSQRLWRKLAKGKTAGSTKRQSSPPASKLFKNISNTLEELFHKHKIHANRDVKCKNILRTCKI